MDESSDHRSHAQTGRHARQVESGTGGILVTGHVRWYDGEKVFRFVETAKMAGYAQHATALREAVYPAPAMIPAIQMALPAAKAAAAKAEAAKPFPPVPFLIKTGPLAGGRVEWIDRANDLAFVVDAAGQERLVPTHRLSATAD